MVCFNGVWLGFIVYLCLWVFEKVDCRVINIYLLMELESVLVNLSWIGWMNYVIEVLIIDI